MTVDQFSGVLLLGAVAVLLAVASVRVAVRVGVPTLLPYLSVGIALGPAGLGITFDVSETVQTLGYAALVVILAEGGLTTRWSTVRPVLPAAAVLSTVGVIVSWLGVAGAARWLLDIDWQTALVLGAVVSSTDAAATFSTLRGMRVARRPAALLEAESGFNDAPTVLLVVAMSAPDWNSTSPLGLAALIAYELGVGAVIGGLVGQLGIAALRRAALPAAGLYPLATITFAVSAYGAASMLHGSGFLAVYVAAVVLGNARLPHHRATRGFAEGLGWLAQIGLFILLGLLVDPAHLPAAIVPALVVAGALLLFARPLSVAVSATPFRIPWREQAFLSWGGLRGAVPIVLAIIPATQGLPGADLVFDEVFVLVVVLTLVQGPTLRPVAERLRIAGDLALPDLTVESAPLDEMRADLVQVEVGPRSRLVGVYLYELRLPKGAAVTLVVRGAEPFVPDTQTRLRTGDRLLVVASAQVREATETRLQAVHKYGPLAGWQAAREARPGGRA